MKHMSCLRILFSWFKTVRMRQSRSELTLVLALAGSALALTGCDRAAAQIATVAEPEVIGPQYSASKGLFVPEETRRALGVKIVPISERPVAESSSFEARVYATAEGVARVSAIVPTATAARVKPGQLLTLRRGENTASATIRAVNDELASTTGSVEILADTMGQGTTFEIGEFVAAQTPSSAGQPVAAVPRSAVLEAVDGTYVYTVSGDNFVRTAVTIGAKNGEFVEIKEGLYSGDEVVSEAVMSLWMTELAAIKGGHACCVAPPKGK